MQSHSEWEGMWTQALPLEVFALTLTPASQAGTRTRGVELLLRSHLLTPLCHLSVLLSERLASLSLHLSSLWILHLTSCLRVRICKMPGTREECIRLTRKRWVHQHQGVLYSISPTFYTEDPDLVCWQAVRLQNESFQTSEYPRIEWAKCDLPELCCKED